MSTEVSAVSKAARLTAIKIVRTYAYQLDAEERFTLECIITNVLLAERDQCVAECAAVVEDQKTRWADEMAHETLDCAAESINNILKVNKEPRP